MLSEDFLDIEQEQGTEITVVSNNDPISKCISRHLQGAYFSATLHPGFRLDHHDDSGPMYFSLLENKYNESIGGCITIPDSNSLILLLPHFKDKDHFIDDLISNVLPEIRPELFPYNQKNEWLHKEEYEHPLVKSLVKQQKQILEKANEQVEAIALDIEKESTKLKHLHGVLTETGDKLVGDVKSVLEELGFTEVMDADEFNSEGAMQEDLQIRSISPRGHLKTFLIV